MFTECQPIKCRSLAPLQDTPSIKSTYVAGVIGKKQFEVRMSGELTYREDYNSTYHKFYFT